MDSMALRTARILQNVSKEYWRVTKKYCSVLEMPILTRASTVDELAKLTDKGFVYVILDACDTDNVVPEKAVSLGDEVATSLYNGTAQEEYWAIAPYLFQADRALFQWLQETLWSEAWGIIAVSNAPLADIRAHFRKFLIVQSPEGEHWYFRFYDPRVLPVFLESSNSQELNQFFGPIQAYAVSEPDSPQILLMRKAEEG